MDRHYWGKNTKVLISPYCEVCDQRYEKGGIESAILNSLTTPSKNVIDSPRMKSRIKTPKEKNTFFLSLKNKT